MTKHAGGRPNQIDRDEVLRKRDRLISALSFGWEIGWDLACARTPEQLRHALQPIAHSGNEQLFRSFVRVSTTEASAKDIRATEAQRVRPGRRTQEMLVPLQDSGRSLREIRDAIEAASAQQQSPELMREYFQRWSQHKKLQQEMDQLNEILRNLENRLADQEAFVAQTQLLKFIARAKYAHTPRNLARAMAGLPRIGFWHSIQICQKSPSLFWPEGEEEQLPIHYRIFKIIEECWNQHLRDHNQNLVDLLLTQIRPISKNDPVGRDLRTYWRFLIQAMEETDLGELPSQAVPYRILGKLKEIIGRPHSREELVLAAHDEREAFG